MCVLLTGHGVPEARLGDLTVSEAHVRVGGLREDVALQVVRHRQPEHLQKEAAATHRFYTRYTKVVYSSVIIRISRQVRDITNRGNEIGLFSV